MAISPFSSFRDIQILNSTSLQIVSLLNDARMASTASKESSRYGVHFESGRAVYFKGGTFSEPSPYNKEIKLDNSIHISPITLAGGGSDVVFEQLTGETQNYGNVILQSKASATKQKTITISQIGSSYKN